VHNSYQCIVCEFYFDDLPQNNCEAFPDGIPPKILMGEHDHTKPYKGDNGITFEPIEDD